MENSTELPLLACDLDSMARTAPYDGAATFTTPSSLLNLKASSKTTT
jgi:hypothetical protein